MKKIVLIILLFVLSPLLKAQEFLNYDNLCFAKMDSIQLFSVWSRPRALDFDKDGKMDFAVIDKASDSLQIFFNNGAAKFTAIPPLVISIGTSAKDLCVGDFNGDTYTDIATINAQGDLTIFRNLSGTGIMLINSITNSVNPNLEVGLIECGDFNNDSKPDIIGTGKDFSTQRMQVFTFQNTLSFNFGSITIFPIFSGHNLINGTPTTPLSIADFNSDGFNDFVVGTDDFTDTLEIYPNLGLASISFSSPTVYKEPFGTFVQSLATKDYDLDGKPDIAICSPSGFSIQQNTGALTFSNLYSDSFIFGKNFSIKDVDADSYPDLVIADWPGTFYVYRGTNSLGYPFGFSSTFTVGDSYRFLLEDFDSNLIPDFVFVGQGSFPYILNLRNFSFHLTNTIISANIAVCGTTPVNFTVTNSHSSYPGNYNWTPGPSTSTSFSCNTPGSVDCAFSFTLPPGYGQCTIASNTIFINSQVTPSALISATVSAINCPGSSVPLEVSSLPVYTTFTWSTGQTTSSIVVSPTTTTTYTIFLNNGCLGMETYTINVSPSPTVSISSSVTSICIGDSVLLTGSGGVNYQWLPSMITSNSIYVKPSTSTGYSLVGDNTNGCYDTAFVNITVNTIPVLNIASSKPTVCMGDTVTLSASGASTYSWSTGSTSYSTQVTPNIVFYTYTVTGNNGCLATKIFSITVKIPPIVTTAVSKPTVCNGDSVTLQAFGASTYTWVSSVPNFYLGSTFFHYPVSNTSYTVLGQAPNGCYNYSITSINISNLAPVNIPSVELCRGQATNISAFGASTYTWSTGFIGQSFSYTPPDLNPITYSVTATDINGCKSTASQVFVISEKCQLVVYNGVTPNGDGHNDYFHIGNIEQYPGNLVLIYNRWGQKLAEIKDYDNLTKHWSGTNQGEGKSVPSGTYYYIINLNNNTDLLKGYIELTKKDFN